MNKCDFCTNPCGQSWCPTNSYTDCAESPVLVPYKKGCFTDRIRSVFHCMFFFFG